MKKKNQMDENSVRVIKISKDALFEFVYEKMIDNQEIFLEKRKDYRKTQDAKRYPKQTTVIENRKARFILKYFRITSIIHVVYAILDIVLGLLLNGILCIGIFPLAIHFIISSIVIWNMLDHIRLTEDEQTIIDYWKVCGIGTFIIAFLSVIVAAMLA